MNERIHELRKIMNLTLSDFGERIGLSSGALSDVERGRYPVQERHIKLILSAFPDVSETWLRSGDGEMFRSPDDEVSQLVAQYGFPEICAKLLRTFDALPAEKQDAVLDFARSFVASMIRDDAEKTAAEILRPESRESAAARAYISSRVMAEIDQDQDAQKNA